MTLEVASFQAFLDAMQDQDRLQWRKAHICASVRQQLGEKALRHLGREHKLSPAYLVTIGRVAAAVPIAEIDTKLSFSHYMVSWQADAENWRHWTKLSSENDWSLRQLKDAIAMAKGLDPSAAARKAAGASRTMKTAADEAEGTPAFEEVEHHIESAWQYVAYKSKDAKDATLNPALAEAVTANHKEKL